MKVIVTGFLNTMTRRQRIAGWAYLPVHLLIIPFILAMMAAFMPDSGIDNVRANIIYYAIGVVYCLVFFWTYLRGAFDILLDNILKNVIVFLSAIFLFFLFNMISSALLTLLENGNIVNLNNEAITDLATSDKGAAVGLTVFAAPLVEEILFRGIVFGSIRTKNRVWAYVVSITLFALYHVWQYALIDGDATYLVYAIAYIPAGYVLAWCYERTNCIWADIFLHMIINIAALTAIA